MTRQYSAQEYIELMDKFKAEKIPLSVGVIDMDWHLVEEVEKKDGHGWTGELDFFSSGRDNITYPSESHPLKEQVIPGAKRSSPTPKTS